MRRLGMIVLCLLVAGAAGDAAVASARHAYHVDLAQRHKLCGNHNKRSEGCRSRQHGVGQTKQHSVAQKGQHSVGKTSDDPSPVLPPLDELIAPETVCPGQTDESLSVASQEATMDCMINFVRSQAGEDSLAGAAPLDDSSDAKAGDIIQCDEFSHEACGHAFTYWLEQDGYAQPGGCWGAGENIAWGTGELGTVRSILTGWVYSPDHLDNMLTASFDQFGVGLEVGPLNGYPDAHVWVTHLGVLC